MKTDELDPATSPHEVVQPATEEELEAWLSPEGWDDGTEITVPNPPPRIPVVSAMKGVNEQPPSPYKPARPKPPRPT